MRFSPREIVFAPTTYCNLACPHCTTRRSKQSLPRGSAIRFMKACKKRGIKKIDFTGGEPFLAPDFLKAITRSAVKEGLLFGHIATNGVWFKRKADLEEALLELRQAGYDGSIYLSVDAFHEQKIRKLALFIRTALSIWKRPDLISILAVKGARDADTKKKLRSLARSLGGRLTGSMGPSPYIIGKGLFIAVRTILLSPIGRASSLRDPWDGRWFKEDHCKGPGNIFFIMPNGDVKPCCGYASDLDELTIGNIETDPPGRIMKNVERKAFVRTVFSSGLGSIRRELERSGFTFPAKTTDHCYFCHYLLAKVPARILKACL